MHPVYPGITVDPALSYRNWEHLTWSPLNRSWTGQGLCRANLHTWCLAKSLACDCDQQQQTMNHIVDVCPLTKFEDGLRLFHEAEEDRSQLAGIYSDYSIHEMKLMKW